MKVYYAPRSFRDTDETECVLVQQTGGLARPLPLRLDLRNHSPTGFAWGYMGSGPSQLALAILADLYGDHYALCNYMDFKLHVISSLRQDEPFELKEEYIREVMERVGSKVPLD